MTKRIEIINQSLYVFCMDLQEAIENGYRIDPDNGPVTWGICYQCGMIKESDADGTFSNTPPTASLEVAPIIEKKRNGRPPKVPLPPSSIRA